MNDYFDVFFHQQAIPFTLGTVLYQKDNTEEIVEACETLYERSTGDFLTFRENDEISRKVISSPIKKHVEIQFFQAQLNWDVLLEELEELFPQFVWTKLVEEVDGIFSTYFCELIPVSFSSEEEEEPIQFIVSASLEQMGYSKGESVSSILEAKLLSIFQEEENGPFSGETLSFPVEVSIEENVEKKADFTRSFLDEEEPEDEERLEIEPKDEIEILDIARSEESEVLFLKESLKREKASKERVRVAKEKLEHEICSP